MLSRAGASASHGLASATTCRRPQHLALIIYIFIPCIYLISVNCQGAVRGAAPCPGGLGHPSMEFPLQRGRPLPSPPSTSTQFPRSAAAPSPNAHTCSVLWNRAYAFTGTRAPASSFVSMGVAKIAVIVLAVVIKMLSPISPCGGWVGGWVGWDKCTQGPGGLGALWRVGRAGPWTATPHLAPPRTG